MPANLAIPSFGTPLPSPSVPRNGSKTFEGLCGDQNTAARRLLLLPLGGGGGPVRADSRENHGHTHTHTHGQQTHSKRQRLRPHVGPGPGRTLATFLARELSETVSLARRATGSDPLTTASGRLWPARARPLESPRGSSPAYLGRDRSPLFSQRYLDTQSELPFQNPSRAGSELRPRTGRDADRLTPSRPTHPPPRARGKPCSWAGRRRPHPLFNGWVPGTSTSPPPLPPLPRKRLGTVVTNASSLLSTVRSTPSDRPVLHYKTSSVDTRDGTRTQLRLPAAHPACTPLSPPHGSIYPGGDPRSPLHSTPLHSLRAAAAQPCDTRAPTRLPDPKSSPLQGSVWQQLLSAPLRAAALQGHRLPSQPCAVCKCNARFWSRSGVNVFDTARGGLVKH